MTQQPSLFSQAPAPDPDQLPPGRRGEASQKTPLWLVYLELSVRVVVRIYIGLVLIVLPWTHFWTDNRLLLLIPHLGFIAANGITRGVVSGLGMLNIWIGISDAVHYKEAEMK